MIKTTNFLILFFTLLSINVNASNDKPNIIIFLVDDMGVMDTSQPFLSDENGNQKEYPLNHFYQTPNMETLAKKGVRFETFYAHSVCSPSRTSIMTGQNSARHGVTNWIKAEANNKGDFGPEHWNWKGIAKEDVTIPQLLKKEGYKTIHVGKAHFGPMNSEGGDPKNIGFDVNIAGNYIGHPGSYYGEAGYGNISGNKDRAVPDLEEFHGKDIFLSEALTLKAKEEITKAKEENKPFFLNMSHYAVHAPFQTDKRFIDNYKNLDYPEKAQAFATLIEGMDKSLGDIMQHVAELGIGENTIILFVGDNGSDAPLVMDKKYGSSTPLKGKKGMHWEGGMRVPFIAAWVSPNEKSTFQKHNPISQNTVQHQMGTILDIFPTVCKIAGVKVPKGHTVDGFDLHKQMAGKENNKRKTEFLNHYPHKHRSSYFTSYVLDTWKVVYHYPIEDSPKYELFDLEKDPYEKENLVESNKMQLNKMMLALKNKMDEQGALYPEKEGEKLHLIIPEVNQ